MAHFAKLNEENTVTYVIAVDNDDINHLPFPESEPVGVEFLINLFGPAVWKQTSYNSNFRKHYAGIDWTYDSDKDAFIPPKPYSSWLLNEQTYLWDPPVPHPNDGNQYVWNEDTQFWTPVNS